MCFTLHLKLKPKTLGNYIRGSGVGYPLDMAQGAPIYIFLNIHVEDRPWKHRYRNQKYVYILITGRAMAICILHIFHTLWFHDTIFTRKKMLFHSKDFMRLFTYQLEYQTTQIPTGFVSVAISGGFCENWARLIGLKREYVLRMWLGLFGQKMRRSN